MAEKPKESRIKIAVAVVLMGFVLWLAFDAAQVLLFGHSHGPDYGGTAISSLRSYVGAQCTFQRADRYGKKELLYANPTDGKGFPDLYRAGGPLEKETGDELKLIDIAFARATSPESAKYGYWFADILAGPNGPFDFRTECGLCAVPATYGGNSIDTYIVDLTGMIYAKDTGGKPVTVWPDVEKDGWRAVGN